MKRLILTYLLLTSFVCLSQGSGKLFSGGLILTNYNLDSRESSNLGIGAAFTLWNVYFDISSNWVSGRGNYLDFQSSQSYDTNKTNLLSINGGYSFRVNNRISITPTIGATSITDIWEDPIGNTTNFSVDRGTRFGAGVNVQIEPIHPLNIMVGYGTNDGLRIGVIMDFNSRL
jgi:hypothetical protein